MRLWQDLQDHWCAQEALAEELAVKHSKTVKWMKEAVLCVGKYGASPHKVAPHNAWLHAKSLEINPRGGVLERRPKGRDGQDDEVFGGQACVHDRIEKDLVALGQSCKTSSLCVTVRMAPHHLNAPMFAADDISKDFIEIVLGWDINEFCLKYESFALFRLKGHGMTERKGVALNNNDKAIMTRRWVCGKITRALREITGNPTLDMSWKNYEKDIVDEYHVILEGWPSLVFDPLKLGFKGLEPILQAIEDGICKWRWLTDDEFTACKNEVAANGGDKKKVRKERSDKGKKRGTYKGSEGSSKKSHGLDSGSDEDSSKWNGKTGTIKEINVTVGKLESILSIVLDMYQKIWRLDEDFGGRAVLAVSNDGGGWTHDASTSDICHAWECRVVADLAKSRQSDGLIKALR
ncbi:hypothetical protein K439DRAFT_1622766 [Ramaria rubella]|nr:hypothetical protein K439DRAFT_1622766 [Ramaria rubella]